MLLEQSPSLTRVSVRATGSTYLTDAASVGAYLVSKLLALADTPTTGALIGDVRGAGLFVGIEFVRY